jgi:hypothetical protein
MGASFSVGKKIGPFGQHLTGLEAAAADVAQTDSGPSGTAVPPDAPVLCALRRAQKGFKANFEA